jgi:hypothetical protein
MKYLGVIKNRYSDDSIPWPEDIWVNKKYRVRLDGREWCRIISFKDLCMASIIELTLGE